MNEAVKLQRGDTKNRTELKKIFTLRNGRGTTLLLVRNAVGGLSVWDINQVKEFIVGYISNRDKVTSFIALAQEPLESW